VTARLDRFGFYPAGGGRFHVEVQPARALSPLRLDERGEIRARRATALFAGLPFDVARRELETVRARLGWDASTCRPHELADSFGPGNVVQIEIESEHVTELFTGFGEKGIRAEVVAERVAAETETYLAAGVPVGQHLADQLLLPLALAGGGGFRTLAPTLHTETQIAIVRRLIGVEIVRREIAPGLWQLDVAP
jgi:RNA 3'-terminal phosphate cyclase (ATP)